MTFIKIQNNAKIRQRLGRILPFERRSACRARFRLQQWLIYGIDRLGFHPRAGAKGAFALLRGEPRPPAKAKQIRKKN
jgi:hypothetical protein